MSERRRGPPKKFLKRASVQIPLEDAQKERVEKLLRSRGLTFTNLLLEACERFESMCASEENAKSTDKNINIMSIKRAAEAFAVLQSVLNKAILSENKDAVDKLSEFANLFNKQANQAKLKKPKLVRVREYTSIEQDELK